MMSDDMTSEKQTRNNQDKAEREITPNGSVVIDAESTRLERLRKQRLELAARPTRLERLRQQRLELAAQPTRFERLRQQRLELTAIHADEKPTWFERLEQNFANYRKLRRKLLQQLAAEREIEPTGPMETKTNLAPIKTEPTQTNQPTSITDRIRCEITEIEHREDMTVDQKVSRITHIACATCAGIAIQPIPFADIFILTPLQAYFASRIAAIRGVPVSEADAADWVKEIVGIVGLGIVAQQVAIAVWKTVTFGLGSLLTIPLVYSLTYAIMRVSDVYYDKKSRKETLTNEEIQEIWKEARRRGEKIGSDEEQNIRAQRGE
jgi:uncharacterized protein (DUF697 family)